MASTKGNKSIKTNPELFSEETKTASERILDELEQQKSSNSDANKDVSEQVYFQIENDDEPQANTASAEQLVTDLLSKYYRGDHDVEYSRRFDHKDDYKHELILLLKQYGITYVTKHHYPLSKDELHVIRMDFFGRIREPDLDKLSPLYRGYLSLKNRTYTKEKNLSDTSSRRKKRRTKTNLLPPSSEYVTTYPLSAYDLSQKSEWSRVYRLFPRFHSLEHKMLQTIQAMHIPPEQLALMNIYDFSDILYRTFRKSEKSRDAHLFLGARQAFIKDVFKKNEAWIRQYLTRQNIHPRYIEALIKSAQSKGVTNDIHIASDIHTCMSEYAVAHAEEFQNFIIQSIRSDDYATQIRSRIQNNDYNIEGSALHFLENTQKQFSQFIKKNLLEENYAISLYEQFSHKIPSYVLDDIKGYIKENPQKFTQYLSQLDISPNLQKGMIKHLPDLTDPEQRQIVTHFIQTDQDSFFVYLLDNSRSIEYAKFALQTLDETPKLTDFGKDIITSFILSESHKKEANISELLLEKIKQSGLTPDALKEISPYVRNHFSALQNYFKQSNILTFDELQNELIENRKILVQNNALPESMNNLHKSFVLSNASYFKDWYINFHTKKYKENAAEAYEQINSSGINENNVEICCEFIKKRLSNFMEFSEQHNLSSANIIQKLHYHKILDDPALSDAVYSFICRYNSTFKNFLLQEHLQQKETNFDIMLKKIKQQGISEQASGLIHKFIIDNQPLYTEYQRKAKHLDQQVEQIYSRVINNKPSATDKVILNEYLNDNIYNYMIFQQDNSQLLPYVKKIIQNIKHTDIGSTEEHWLRAYAHNTSDQFKEFLVDNHYANEEKSEALVKNIQLTKKHMVVRYNDGSVLKIILEVHHKNACQDSGELKIGSHYQASPKTPQLTEQTQQQAQNFLREVEEENALSENITHENIAQINDFRNLCIFTQFWHKLMHSMDSTEPVEDRERFVARLMPTDPNIIFFGSEKTEDQLCYDYANDQRTKRYNRHLRELVISNKGLEL